MKVNIEISTFYEVRLAFVIGALSTLSQYGTLFTVAITRDYTVDANVNLVLDIRKFSQYCTLASVNVP